jgi:putative Mg2+ transporter-C (MgtC) family protein
MMALPAEGRMILDIVIAYLMALPVGWEREHHERSAGLRTFPLVCVASCALVVVSGTVGPSEQSRVIQGLIGGIGFIGGGTILKSGLTVHGTATAAGILVTAVIGVSVGHHLYLLALVLSVLSLITLRVFQAWKLLDPNTNQWNRHISK